MTVDVTHSEYSEVEAYPYGDGTVYERGIYPASAEIEFEDWAHVVEALQDWHAGKKFSDVFDISDDGPDHAPRVEPENITFVLRDQPAVVAIGATTEPGQDSLKHANEFLRGTMAKKSLANQFDPKDPMKHIPVTRAKDIAAKITAGCKLYAAVVMEVIAAKAGK